MSMLENGQDLLDYGTQKSGLSYKWFDESSRLIEWFLHAVSDWIIFGLTTNLLGVFDIYWMSHAVELVVNVCFKCPKEKFQN